MLRSSLRIGALAVAALAGFGAASATAQELDGAWFKLKVTTTGYTIDGQTGAVRKTAGKVTQYMQLHWTGTTYAFDIWGEPAVDQWQIVYADDFGTLAGGNPHLVMTDVYMKFVGEEGRWGGGFMTGGLFITRNKAGALTGAMFRSFGGEITDGTLDGVNAYRGGYSVSGKMILPAKLPFAP